MIAYSRPFWPLFLHVFAAMVLFGAVLSAAITSFVAWRRSEIAVLRRATFLALVTAVPAYVVFRVGAQWIYSKEGFSGKDDPTWIGIGFMASDIGLLVLIVSLGFAFWWQRGGKPVAGRIVAGLSAVYLVLLAVAWMAMSGKWG